MENPFSTLVRCEELGLTPDTTGKVREIFDLGDELLLVTTDRISAYDVIMDQPVPGRGALLTQMTLAWYEHFGDSLRHHLVHADAEGLPEPFRSHADRLRGRVMLVRKARRYDIEAVVRGYLAGSGYLDYQRSGELCGHRLPQGLQLCAKLPQPIFTPATKAEEGHDENIDAEAARRIVGDEAFEAIESLSLKLYEDAVEYARGRGIIIADTKFEFGVIDGRLTLIDEMLTPDSSRYWDAERYEPGREQDSMDKQLLRNHLSSLDWDKTPPPPRLDEEILERTAQAYVAIFRRLFPERARECGY